MQTIGERLEDARKRKGLSIREAAEATKIRGDYLQKFEGNQFNIGLTDIYIRGFLRNYATFLQLPADRIVADYDALGHAEPRPRQPSREVYGRMEVSVSGPGGGGGGTGRRGAVEPAGGAESGGGASEAFGNAAGAGAAADAPRPTLRAHASGLPPAKTIDPSLVFKILIGGAGVVMLLLIVFLVKSLVGSSPKVAEHPALMSAPTVAATPVPDPDATLVLAATAPVSVHVVGAADGREIWTGQLTQGERHELPNVGLRVTTSAIEALQIGFKGSWFRFGAGARGARTADIPVQK